jgi:epsilon-lactone hydrolase
MLSIRARLHRYLLSHARLFELDVVPLRRKLETLGKRARVHREVSVNRLTVGQVPTLELVPRQARGRETLVYFHGGGGCLGLTPLTTAFASRLAHVCRMRVLLPDYRIAPEQPFPAAFDDAVAVIGAVLGETVASERLVLAGDSFGFGLGLAALAAGDREWRRRFALAVGFCPLVDLTGDSATLVSRRTVDPYRSSDPLRLARIYAGAHDLSSPRLSPLFAPLQGMPRLLLRAAQDDVFLGDAERLADAAKQAGVAAELRIFPRLWHVFQLSAGSLPEADRALDEIATALAS